MSKILFYLIIKPLSFLPYGVLHVISRCFYFLMYYVIGYRKKVVRQNLRNSFPEKSESEIKSIEKKFYKHFLDIIIESVKLFSVSEKQLQRRMRVTNPEVVDQYSKEGQSVIIVGGHYNSWEMAGTALGNQIHHQAVALYSVLKDPFFDRIMKDSRERFGTRMVSTKRSSRFFAGESRDNCAIIFGADQSPTYNKSVYWTTFLNQETALAVGTEAYAKKYNFPVIYVYVRKQKRSTYTMTFEVITDKPQETPEGYISVEHTKRLESEILNEPEFWLWTHKRWKRKRLPDEKLL